MKLRDIVPGLVFLYLELACCQQTAHNESQPETPEPTVPAGNSPDTTTGATEAGHPLGRLERSRLARIAFLQQHVLDSLGWESPPDITPEDKIGILSRLPTPVFVSRQKHCYYPACKLNDLPDYMNRTIWFDASSRNIRYYFSIPTNFDPNYEISSASIKLHLKSRSDCPCDFDHEIVTSRLHIKIYQYRRPVRYLSRLRHSNMRLIDAKMVTWEGSRWVTLSVTDAVKRIVQRGRRNGGFEIQVRDMAENTMNANWVIDPTVCTFETAFDCTTDEADTEGAEEQAEPNYSPVLKIVSTTTTIIDI